MPGLSAMTNPSPLCDIGDSSDDGIRESGSESFIERRSSNDGYRAGRPSDRGDAVDGGREIDPWEVYIRIIYNHYLRSYLKL